MQFKAYISIDVWFDRKDVYESKKWKRFALEISEISIQEVEFSYTAINADLLKIWTLFLIL